MMTTILEACQHILDKNCFQIGTNSKEKTKCAFNYFFLYITIICEM